MTEFPEMQDVLMKQVRCLRGVSASLVIARGPLTRLLLSISFFVCCGATVAWVMP